MRIIAGQYRGRYLAGPPGKTTRPILDRAKTILFDMLGHRLARPGVLPPVAVLDIFSGTGTLGIEALSRGARFCRFIEQQRAAADLLRKNLATLSIGAEAAIMQTDATRCHFPPPPPPIDDSQNSNEDSSKYELVFLDPPYRMLAGPKLPRAMGQLLGRLAFDPAIANSALIVVRQPIVKNGQPSLAPLVPLDRREVASMVLHLMQRPDGKEPATNDSTDSRGLSEESSWPDE